MSNVFANYSRVRLVADKYAGDGASRGAIGYIIATRGDVSYEVEFSDSDGVTFAQVVAASDDLELAE